MQQIAVPVSPSVPAVHSHHKTVSAKHVAITLPAPQVLGREGIEISPAPPCPVAPAVPKPRRTQLWRSACRHVASPVLKFYDRVTIQRLYRHGFTSVRLDVAGLSMHGMRAPGQGKLPPIAVIHGLSGSLNAYHSLLIRLQKEFSEVIAVDLPGHGSSLPYPNIAADTFIGATRTALDALISKPTIVFGHSLGGMVAAKYASLSPERVAGLVLAAPAGGPVDDKLRCKMVHMFEVRTHHDAKKLVQRTFAPPGWMQPFLTAGTQARFMDPATQRLIHSELPQQRLPRHLLHELKMPTLLLWGENERLIPAQHFDFFKRHLPEGSQAHVLKGVNHSNIAGSPSPVDAELREFATSRAVHHRARNKLSV